VRNGFSVLYLCSTIHSFVNGEDREMELTYYLFGLVVIIIVLAVIDGMGGGGLA
jgi:hypothetical protein